MTALRKEISHSLSYVTEGQQTGTETEREHRGKRHFKEEREIPWQVPSGRQENALVSFHIFISKVFVCQIYGNIV
jgi:hypothetical protein